MSALIFSFIAQQSGYGAAGDAAGQASPGTDIGSAAGQFVASLQPRDCHGQKRVAAAGSDEPHGDKAGHGVALQAPCSRATRSARPPHGRHIGKAGVNARFSRAPPA